MKSTIKYPKYIYIASAISIINGLIMLTSNSKAIITNGIFLLLIGIIFAIFKNKIVYLSMCIILALATISSILTLFFNNFKGESIIILISSFLFVIKLIEDYRFIFGKYKGHLEAYKKYKLALKFERKVEFDKALTLYNEIISEYPNTQFAIDAKESLNYIKNE